MISTTGRSPEHRRADAGADEALLGDRRVAHAVGAELVHQAGGDLVGALEDADLLAHEEDALVARELLAQREAQRLAVGHPLGAGRLPSGVSDALMCPAPRRRPAPPRRTRCPAACARTARREPVGVHAPASASTSRLGAVVGELDRGLRRARRRARRSRRRSVVADARARAAARATRTIGSCCLALGDLVLRAVGEAGVGDRVAAVAVGDRLEHGGLALLARARRAAGRWPRCTASRSSPSTRSPCIRYARGALVQLRLGRRALDARAHAVAVVDDEEDDRQLPQRGEVQRLVPGADVHGAVAELAEHRLRACRWRTSASARPVATGSWPPTMPQPP